MNLLIDLIGLFKSLITKKAKNFSTPYSRVVPHHSTDGAVTSLTLEIGRDPVLSSAYGRSWTKQMYTAYKSSLKPWSPAGKITHKDKNFTIFSQMKSWLWQVFEHNWIEKKFDSWTIWFCIYEERRKKRPKMNFIHQLFLVRRCQLVAGSLYTGYFWVSNAKISRQLL